MLWESQPGKKGRGGDGVVEGGGDEGAELQREEEAPLQQGGISEGGDSALQRGKKGAAMASIRMGKDEI